MKDKDKYKERHNYADSKDYKHKRRRHDHHDHEHDRRHTGSFDLKVEDTFIKINRDAQPLSSNYIRNYKLEDLANYEALHNSTDGIATSIAEGFYEPTADTFQANTIDIVQANCIVPTYAQSPSFYYSNDSFSSYTREFTSVTTQRFMDFVNSMDAMVSLMKSNYSFATLPILQYIAVPKTKSGNMPYSPNDALDQNKV